MLEVGLVVAARRQQHDVRRCRRRAGACCEQRVLQRAEEQRQPLHVQLAEGVGKQARDRERGSRARSRRPTAPACGWRARATRRRRRGRGRTRRQWRRTPAGGRDAVARAQEPGMAEDERRRQQSVAQQPLRAVEVGGDRVRAAARAGCRPAASRSHSRPRHDVAAARRAPRDGRCRRRRVDVVGDAVLVELPRDAAPARRVELVRARGRPRAAANAAQCGRERRRTRRAARRSVRRGTHSRVTGSIAATDARPCVRPTCVARDRGCVVVIRARLAHAPASRGLRVSRQSSRSA